MKTFVIYRILNKINKKFYLGATSDPEFREWTHFNLLDRNAHPNKYLQSSYNKNGRKAFIFEVLEVSTFKDKKEMFQVEQKYIDLADKKMLYNLTFIAGGGGSDARNIEVFLLNLKGKFLKKYNSLQDLRRSLKSGSQLSNYAVNSGTIFHRKYRIVTPEFYKHNIETIKSWKSLSNPNKKNLENISKRCKKRQIVIIIYTNGVKIEFENLSKLGNHLNLTKERIRQILVNKKKKLKNKVKEKDYTIKYKYPKLQKNAAKQPH